MTRRIIKLVISAAFWACSAAWQVVLKVFGRPLPGTCVVLYYHVVRPEERERFARQMDILLALAQAISIENPPKLTPGVNYAVVTFDDGFRETIEIVLQELKKRNIPITVLVPTGCLGSEPSWVTDRSSHHYGGAILSEDEIRKIDAEPLVSFGSHCVTHRPLSTVSTDEARDEIVTSKAALEDILGHKVESLSFPHGVFEPRHAYWAWEAGYRRVYSIEPSVVFVDSDEFVTGRFRVDPTDWRMEFQLKILGSYRWLSLMKRGQKNA